MGLDPKSADFTFTHIVSHDPATMQATLWVEILSQQMSRVRDSQQQRERQRKKEGEGKGKGKGEEEGEGE